MICFILFISLRDSLFGCQMIQGRYRIFGFCSLIIGFFFKKNIMGMNSCFFFFPCSTDKFS
jgi:hypothetical protein